MTNDERKEAAKWFENRIAGTGFPGAISMYRRAVEALLAGLDDEPENDWIPCNERMPEEHEWIGTKRFGTTISDEVYVTFEAPDGQRFTDHISFQNGKLSSSDAERMRVWYKGAKPIAWMPKPKPYKPKGENA